MDDGSWMRLEIKLDADQREAVTRLGLDPFDLSGETHRMHALQLADPKAAEVFDPKAWERIKNRANDIKLEVTPPALPKGLNATLRPLPGRRIPVPRLPLRKQLRWHPCG